MSQDLFYLADGNSLATYLADRMDSIEVEYEFDDHYPIDIRPVLPIVAVTVTRNENVWQFHIYVDDFRCLPKRNITTVIAYVPSLFIASIRTSSFFDSDNVYNICEFYASLDGDGEDRDGVLVCFMEERLLGYQDGKPVYRPFYVLNPEDRISCGLKWPFTRVLNQCTSPFNTT